MLAESTADTALWQREQKRRRLLEQLGYTPLISRAHIKGAATNRLCAPPRDLSVGSPRGLQPEIGSEPAVARPNNAGTSNRDVSDQSAQSALAALKSTVAGNPTEVSAATTASQVPRAAPTANTVTEAVSFSLLIASSGPLLWVEHLPDALVTREHLQLLQSMAVAVIGDDAKLGHRQFDWPLMNAPQLPKNLETARQSVTGHLTRWAREQSAEILVVCGESTGEFLTNIPGLSQQSIPSVHDMLTTPALKRVAWQQLRPLSKR